MEYYNKIVINGVEYPLETVIVGGGAPTNRTPANVGQFYANTADGFELYICIDETSAGYTTWQKIIQTISTNKVIEIVNSVS